MSNSQASFIHVDASSTQGRRLCLPGELTPVCRRCEGATHPTCVTTDLPAPRNLGTKECPDWASCLPEMDTVDKTGVCLSGASNVLAANSKSKTRVPCLFGGDEPRYFDKAQRSFNNRKRIDLIVDNEYNGVYGPEQTTSMVLTVYMVDLGLVNPSGRNGNRPNELYKRD
ncbi:hypothetical protein FB451DRAFT_1365746 [Mycena latifolia]|nr:hypothetical protein FB451DRAFT_1365746 [Mycena latifolia]